MKIVIFVHCFFPEHIFGTETYTLGVAKTLISFGHDVHVVAGVFQGEKPREALSTDYVFNGVPVTVLDKNFVPHSRILETYYQEEMRSPLRATLERLAPDVIHVTHLINHTAVLLEEAAALGIPSVATMTDFFGFCYNNKLENAAGQLCHGPNGLRSNCLACHIKGSRILGSHRQQQIDSLPWGWDAVGLGVRIANRVGIATVPKAGEYIADLAARPNILLGAYGHYAAMIAPTQFLAKAYVKNNFPADRIKLSHFGVDISRELKPPRTTGGPLKLGFIGQLAEHKGVTLLLRAVSALPVDEVTLTIYGSEEQDPAYSAELRALAGLNVSFKGTFPSDHMAAVMAGLDVLVIPSTWYENSPLVLLNALATHTPVVVSDVEGLTEFVSDRINGWSFRRGDLADLTAKLRNLVKHPEQVQSAIANTSYERNTVDVVHEIEAIYIQVIGAAALIPEVVNAQARERANNARQI